MQTESERWVSEGEGWRDGSWQKVRVGTGRFQVAKGLGAVPALCQSLDLLLKAVRLLWRGRAEAQLLLVMWGVGMGRPGGGRVQMLRPSR